jgi:transposase-like protein
MKLSLILPAINRAPTHRPRACVYCGQPILQRHGTVSKPIKDHRLSRVTAHRYKCLSCGRTFRHYPAGTTKKDQSQRMVILASLMYGLGLSYSAASRLLGALGARVGKTTVSRNAQEAGEALRRTRPAGRVRILGPDETVFGIEGRGKWR